MLKRKEELKEVVTKQKIKWKPRVLKTTIYIFGYRYWVLSDKRKGAEKIF